MLQKFIHMICEKPGSLDLQGFPGFYFVTLLIFQGFLPVDKFLVGFYPGSSEPCEQRNRRFHRKSV